MHLSNLTSLFWTCKSLREAATTIHIHHVRMLLRHYAPNPSEFHGFMREQNCVISGLAVLWLIEGIPSIWHPSAMHLWIPNRATRYVEDHLHGLGYEGWDWKSMPSRSGIKSITRCINKKEAQIWTVESPSVNPIMPVTRLQTTLLMNYLKPDFLVLFYPALTLAKVNVVLNLWDQQPPRWLWGLSRCGYTICQQRDWMPNWVSRLNIVFPQEKGDRRKFIAPITCDSILLPSNGLPRFDIDPHPCEFPFDPSCHQFCICPSCRLPENHKLALASLHSPHILYWFGVWSSGL